MSNSSSLFLCEAQIQTGIQQDDFRDVMNKNYRQIGKQVGRWNRWKLQAKVDVQITNATLKEKNSYLKNWQSSGGIKMVKCTLGETGNNCRADEGKWELVRW